MLATAILCALLIVAHHLGFRLNVTPSLARGIYRLSDEPPKRGEVVAFCLSGASAELARERDYILGGSCPSGLRPLMKQLAGVPFDLVSIEEYGILCGPQNDLKLWPVHTRTRDRKGRNLSPARIGGTVPEGMALVLTLPPGSFDSRYFGFVPLASLQKMEPVLTF